MGETLALGDFDGNGSQDLATGDPRASAYTTSTLTESGAVYVNYGSSAGLDAGSGDYWDQAVAGVLGDAESGDAFGGALAVGDFDGDGYDDLAIGIPKEDIGAIVDAGAVQILYGSSNGLSTAGNQLLYQDYSGVLGASEAGELMGFSLVAADFNGDGKDDLAVGIPLQDLPPANDAGVVQIFYGSTTGLSTVGNQLFGQDLPGVAGYNEDSDEFATSLASGDFDSDGYDDLAIGVPHDNVGSWPYTSAGAVNVIFGSPTGLSTAHDEFWNQDAVGVDGDATTGDDFGSALATEDFNGDGYDDIAVGIPNKFQGGYPKAGSIQILYGAATGLTYVGNQHLSRELSTVAGIVEEDDRFGTMLVASDFDGDGRGDLIVGVPGPPSSGPFPDQGELNVFYGSASGLSLATDYQITVDPGFDILSRMAAGDILGNGGRDLAAGIGTSAMQKGQVLVYRTGCGNELVDGTETCDDGGIAPGDGCSASCQVEPDWTCFGAPSHCNNCGNGIFESIEQCDDEGVANGDGCSSTCEVEPGWTCTGQPSVCSYCGDGVVESDETCDDGGTDPGDGCSATCQIEPGWVCIGEPSVCGNVCGNGTIEGGETCDDGGTTGSDGCDPNCQLEPGWSCTGAPTVCTGICGDGVILEIEICDDGNTNAGDGCDPTCDIEGGWTCIGEPSACNDCGNGTIEGVEACDDGSISPLDGCDPSCQIEPGWTCIGAPSICAGICGDGLVAMEPGYPCDDGNTVSGDGCSASCQVEPDWMCMGEPSVCDGACGDEVILGSEACDDGGWTAGDGCDPTCQVEEGWTCIGQPSVCNNCGDGSIDGIEACDDGNTASGDGCDTFCELESGWICAGEPSVCDGDCGDGEIRGTETCEDYNGIPGDGCDTMCQIEPGWTCSGLPSICNDCDNGLLEGNEACDDANATSNDGCNAVCQVEEGWTCSDEPSVCTQLEPSVPGPGLWIALPLVLTGSTLVRRASAQRGRA
jgi:cysteine-rich repeat protein